MRIGHARHCPIGRYTGPMNQRAFDPNRLDLVAFCRQAAALSGEWPQARFDRLSASLEPVADALRNSSDTPYPHSPAVVDDSGIGNNMNNLTKKYRPNQTIFRR